MAPEVIRAPFSDGSLRTVAGVGTVPGRTTTRTMLFLSRKTVAFGPPLWAQPSGYLIDQPEGEW